MKILAVIVCYNEHVKIERTLSRFPAQRPYDLLVLDDGSTDDTAERVRKFKDVILLSHPTNLGVGAAIRTVNRFALEKGYDVIVHVAGNDKDDPMLIPALLKPILEEGFDYVQGSRYLPGGGYGNMPLYRIVGTRFAHPWLFSLVARQRITDSTNGFRAFRVSLLRDERIRLDDPWLDQYELEIYFFCKVIRLGYKVKEVPVTKIYPPKALGYTKMKPFIGWWSILRPLVYLGLGIKE